MPSTNKMPFSDYMPEESWKKSAIAIAYALSPIDLVPEALLGMFGLVDDVAVLLWGLYHLYKATGEKL